MFFSPPRSTSLSLGEIEGLFAWERPHGTADAFPRFLLAPLSVNLRRSSLSPRRHRSGFRNPLRFLRKISPFTLQLLFVSANLVESIGRIHRFS